MNLSGWLIVTILGLGCILFFGHPQLPSITEEDSLNKDSWDKEAFNIPAIEERDSEKITWLKKVGEVKDGFCVEEEYNYFIKITSLCVDDGNDFYVADSGQYRIYKFNHRGKFLYSFGSRGQGQGEFIGSIWIAAGNDGKLYIIDDGNRRLIVFSVSGRFIKQFPIISVSRDTPCVNSNGDIYLLSSSEMKIIDVFSKHMKLKKSLLEMKYHLDFPYVSPPKKTFLRVKRPSIFNVKKLIIENDNLLIFFNNSHKTVICDNKNNILKTFKINHPRFVKDYKARIKNIIEKGGWLNSIGSIVADSSGYLYFSYFNASLGIPEILRYGKDGTFIDTLRAKNNTDPTYQLLSGCDKLGNFYSVEDSSKVIIYQIED